MKIVTYAIGEMRKSLLHPCAGLLLAATLLPAVQAQVPELINYQGRLISGTNLVNGNVALVFRLYDTDTGGSPLCTDSNTVTVTDGLYATWIGDDVVSGRGGDDTLAGGLGSNVLDGGDGTARETLHRLEAADLLEKGPGQLILENSLGTQDILRRSRRMLGLAD